MQNKDEIKTLKLSGPAASRLDCTEPRAAAEILLIFHNPWKAAHNSNRYQGNKSQSALHYGRSFPVR